MLPPKTKNILEQIRQMQEEYPLEYLSLSDLLIKEYVPDRHNPVRGFRFGTELVNGFPGLEKKSVKFPRIHYFTNKNVWATAIKESEDASDKLLDLALHAMISYPLGDCEVYMMDSDIRGPFCNLYDISSNLDDTRNHLNTFHYVTITEEREAVINLLEKTIKNNILNYLKGYDSLMSYNIANDKLIQPYKFLFIRDIGGVFKDTIINQLVNMINNNNATSAGVYIFFTYKEDDLNDKRFGYTRSQLHTLVEHSVSLDNMKCLKVNSMKLWDGINARSLTDKVIDHIKKIPAPESVVSFKKGITKMLQSGSLWDSTEGAILDSITIPLGFKNATNKLEIRFSLEGAPHAYVAGITGHGKTILLHNIILNAALKYSPEQLQFYLIDLKAGGQSFNLYKKLPHVYALSDSTHGGRSFALSVLQNLHSQIESRGQLLANNSSTRLDQYNRKAKVKGAPLLPFIFVIMDEYQELLKGDSTAREATKHLNFVLQQGRSNGVFLILCTQKVRQDGLELAQIGTRLCVKLSDSDSEKLIGNTGASKLSQPGMAIMNLSNNDKTGLSNQLFKVAYIDESNDLEKYVSRIQEIYLNKRNGIDPLQHIIIDGARLSDNPSLPRNKDDKYIYVGVPALCRKRHAGFYLRRETKSNIVIVGNDVASALRLIGVIALQFREIYTNHHIYLSDFQQSGEGTYGILDFLSDLDSDVSLEKARDFNPPAERSRISYSAKKEESAEKEDLLSDLKNLIDKRKMDIEHLAEQPEILCVFINPQPNSLRNNMLLPIMEKGPFLGIHTLLWFYNSNNSNAIIGKPGIDLSEIKISLFGGSPLKAFSQFASGAEQVDRNGMGKLHIPQNMGLTNITDDLSGDPFDIYREIGDNNFTSEAYDKLFSVLSDVNYNNCNRFD